MYTPVLDRMNLHIEAAALTDCGSQRPLNEDTVFEFTSQPLNGSQAGLYLVCDGLGGHEAGDVASQLAVQSVVACLAPVIAERQKAEPNIEAIHQQITRAIARANQKVWAYNTHKDYIVSGRAGTTLTMAFLVEDTAVIANVGDSRTYLYRDGQLEQITKDHSLVAQLVDKGVLAVDEQDRHPWRNIVTRALGRDHEIDIDIFDCDLQPGDKLLLCSDGLWQAFAEEDELGTVLESPGTPQEICWQLIHEANLRDGSDNISAVVVSADKPLLC